MNLEDIFVDLKKTNWWAEAVKNFQKKLFTKDIGKYLILYNADADGFCSSYFIVKTLIKKANSVLIKTKAVWNYEFDFGWLPEYINLIKPDTIICLDLPIIQEPDILHLVGSNTEILIYDHHVVPTKYKTINNVFYVNPRILDDEHKNFPTTFFSSSLSHVSRSFTRNDIIVLACGLYGDFFLKNSSVLKYILEHNFEKIIQGITERKSKIDYYTSKINALFRASPEITPKNAQKFLIDKLNSYSMETALDMFVEHFDLEIAQQNISEEVNKAINDIKSSTFQGNIFCKALKFKTFSVGIVSTVLAVQKFADVIAIGFISKNRIQFELRTHDENDIDLTKLLKKQREYFTPITSGGHPKAAGALVDKKNAKEFCSTLIKSFKALRNRG